HAATIATGPGTLAGRVADGSGTPLPGVQVRAREGGRQFTATTDASGGYRLTLPAGTYRVEFALEGFGTASFDGVAVGGGITRVQDAVLDVGSLGETVEVTAAAAPGRSLRGGAGGGVVGGAVGG